MQRRLYVLLVLAIYSIKALSQEFTDPSRTEFKDNAGLQGSKSGFFQTAAPANYPSVASSWWHLLDVRHSNPNNNYAMQFAGSFYNGDLYFRKTNNNPSQAWSRVLLESGGYVGIGTTLPSTRLQVVGTHPSTQFRLTLPASENGGGSGEVNLQTWVSEPWASWDNGGIGMNVNNDGGANGFGRLNPNLGQSFIRFFPNGGAMQFNTTDNNGTFYGNNMYMAKGNVGIGTSNLTEKLSVNGNIRAKKIIVTQTGWPDYVFHPNYKLRSLASLKSYLEKHQHLPDVPSAAEIEKDGVDLGATQAALLRKIEELVLYVVEQGSMLKDQKKEIINQNKKIELLQNQIGKLKKVR